MRTIILKGGLGNQLFQLSLYLFLKKELRINDLFLDRNIGFIFDYKYQRKYELAKLPKFIRF